MQVSRIPIYLLLFAIAVVIGHFAIVPHEVSFGAHNGGSGREDGDFDCPVCHVVEGSGISYMPDFTVILLALCQEQWSLPSDEYIPCNQLYTSQFGRRAPPVIPFAL